MDVIESIKSLTASRGWTQYMLAKNSDIPESTLKNIFKRGSIPSIPTLEPICAALGVSLSQFFAEDDMFISLTPEQRELLDVWAQLSQAQRTDFLSLMKSVIQ